MTERMPKGDWLGMAGIGCWDWQGLLQVLGSDWRGLAGIARECRRLAGIGRACCGDWQGIGRAYTFRSMMG